jgi:hypothetical protein
MFAGTPFAYLHVCGIPWDGNEYNEGDKAMDHVLHSAVNDAQAYR